METFDLKRILLSDSKTSELGVYNFTPIEVFTINRFLPFGTKLELEERIMNGNSVSNRPSSAVDWAKRLRRTTLKRKRRRKYLRKLVYEGKPNINPNVLMYMKCYLVLNTVFSYKNSDLFKNPTQTSSLLVIEKKMKGKAFTSFFDFKKAMRQCWLFYYINFEHNKEYIVNTAIMSKLTEECFDEVEKMSEADIEEKAKNKILLSAISKINPSVYSYYNTSMVSSRSNKGSSVSQSKSHVNIGQSNSNFNSTQLKQNFPKFITNRTNTPISPTMNMINKSSGMSIPTHIGMSNPPQGTAGYQNPLLVPMTNNEKTLLSERTRLLTSIQLKGILELFKEYLNVNNSDSKFFEFDLEKLGTPELRKLEKYVNECLKENYLKNQRRQIAQVPSKVQNPQNFNYIVDDGESIQMNKLNNELTNTPNKQNYYNISLDNNALSGFQNQSMFYNPNTNHNNNLNISNYSHLLNFNNASNINASLTKKDIDRMSESDSFYYH